MLVRKDLFNQLLNMAVNSAEYLNAKDEDIKWITVKGNHIPIKKGQTQDEAVKDFLSKVESKGSKKVADKTQTKEFKDWFKGSKVVNKEGEPLVVYHGSDKEFDTFSTKNMNGYGGAYFSRYKDVSEVYGNIKEVYLSLKNPLIIDADYKIYDSIEKPDFIETKDKTVDTQQIAAYARDNGYDGVIVKNVKEAGKFTDDYIAFEPNQIKSVDNKGTFNKDSNNINE